VGKSFFNAVGWFAPILIALVATPWLIRELGTGRFGVFSICLLLAVLIPSLDFGFGTAATREIASARGLPDHMEATASELLGLAFVLAMAAFGLLYSLRGQVVAWLSFDQAVPPGEAASLLVLVGIWAAAGYLANALSALPRAEERFSLLATISIASSLALWLGAVVLVSGGYGLRQILTLGTTLTLINAACLFAVNARRIRRIPLPSFRWSILRSQQRFAYHSFASTLASIATYHADKAIVSSALGPSPAGLYSASAGVANKLVGLTAAMAGVLFPRIAHLHANVGGSYRIAKLYFVTNRVMLAVNTSLAATGLVLAERFLVLWLGELASRELVLAFRLLIAAYWLASWSVVAANVLSGTGSAQRAAWFSTAGGILTVISALVLVPRFGLVGAASAGVIGMSQALVFDLLLERDMRRLHSIRGFGRRNTLAACLASGAAAALCAHLGLLFSTGWAGFILAGAAALLVSVVLWFVLGFARREERVLLVHFVKRLGIRRK
jgi:O-antigen/teichoic acid export membrane protein